MTNEGVSLADLSAVRAMVEAGVAESIRRAARLSQAEVAKAAGVSPSTVCRWEKRERAPRGAGAIRYLRVLEGLVAR